MTEIINALVVLLVIASAPLLLGLLISVLVVEHLILPPFQPMLDAAVS